MVVWAKLLYLCAPFSKKDEHFCSGCLMETSWILISNHLNMGSKLILPRGLNLECQHFQGFLREKMGKMSSLGSSSLSSEHPVWLSCIKAFMLEAGSWCLWCNAFKFNFLRKRWRSLIVLNRLWLESGQKPRPSERISISLGLSLCDDKLITFLLSLVKLVWEFDPVSENVWVVYLVGTFVLGEFLENWEEWF